VRIFLDKLQTRLELCEVEVYQVDTPDLLTNFITLPNTLESSLSTELKFCFATKEMRAYNQAPLVSEYRPLDHSLFVIRKPYVFESQALIPDHIRMINNTSPDFYLHGGIRGDYIFVAPNCTQPQGMKYPLQLLDHLNYQTGILRLSDLSRLPMPDNPSLIDRTAELGEPASRELQLCFATFRSEANKWSEFIQLRETLKIIPQPTGVLETFQSAGKVQNLYFTQPVGTSVVMPERELFSRVPPPPPSPIAGQEGDIVILQRDSCLNVATSTPNIPEGPSGRAILEEGGIAGTKSVALGMWNQLEQHENYRICYATAESGGDSQNDFLDLIGVAMFIELDFRAPLFQVDSTVTLGEDIVVRWYANKDYSHRVAHPDDWVALYRKGECTEDPVFTTEYDNEETALAAKHNYIHKCYLGRVDLKDLKETGVVRMSLAQYKSVGEYEMRYFLGDSKHGNGYECRGLRGANTGDYIHCVLRAAAISDTINVVMPSAIGHSNDHNSMSTIPGLETYCDGPLCSYS